MNNQEQDWKKKLEELLQKDENSFINNLTGIRSGRISIDSLATIPVNQSHKKGKLTHISTLKILSAREVAITVFDKKDTQAVIKSVLEANLGYQLQRTQEQILYFSLAPVTEEIRKKLIQKCRDSLESVKISFRNSRQRILNEIKSAKLSSDQEKKTRKQVDDTIHLWNDKALKLCEQKIKELSLS